MNWIFFSKNSDGDDGLIVSYYHCSSNEPLMFISQRGTCAMQ